MLQAQAEGDLLKTYLLARLAGARFALTAVPDDFPEETDSLSFDPRVMRQLFERGRQFGLNGKGWRSVPPGLTRGERVLPRSGVTFTVEDPQERHSRTAPRSGVGLQKLFDRVTDDIRRSPPEQN